jgi:hypothetical protein
MTKVFQEFRQIQRLQIRKTEKERVSDAEAERQKDRKETGEQREWTRR